MDANGIRWVRSARVNTANRTDGVTVMLHDNRWNMVAGKRSKPLTTPPISQFLDKAIEEADVILPPAGWTFKDGTWKSVAPVSGTVWSVSPSEDGWAVHRINGDDAERASRTTFPTADRARYWASVRFDRSVGGLRGPKPRAGAKSAAKLPDVRVTEDEREKAIEVLGALGTSYSEFVRAALTWASENLDQWTVRMIDDQPRLVRRTNA